MKSARGASSLRLICSATIAFSALALGGCVAQAPVQSPGAAPGMGYTCSAGFYVCRMPQQVPLGSQCSCPGIGAPSFGSVQ